MKRLFETSLGHVELELDADEDALLFISLFDVDGGVARSFGSDWEDANVRDMLVSLGLPEVEAGSIGDQFTGAANAEGHLQRDPPRSSAVMASLLAIVAAIIVMLLGIGIWTVIMWVL